MKWDVAIFQCEILAGPSVPYYHSLYLALGFDYLPSFYSLYYKSWANNQRLREFALSLCEGQLGNIQQDITKFWPVYSVELAHWQECVQRCTLNRKTTREDGIPRTTSFEYQRGLVQFKSCSAIFGGGVPRFAWAVYELVYSQPWQFFLWQTNMNFLPSIFFFFFFFTNAKRTKGWMTQTPTDRRTDGPNAFLGFSVPHSVAN